MKPHPPFSPPNSARSTTPLARNLPHSWAFFWEKCPNRLWWLALGLLLLSITACAPGKNASPLETATLSPTPAPTETILWFPPTATHTPFPTFQPSATLEPFPGMGTSLYTDNFTDPLNWTNARTESLGSNNVLLIGNRLTLSANAAPAALTTLRAGLILTDFYAETRVNLHRCAPPDTYGMYFRAATEAYAYRFTFTCDGQMRAERTRGGEVYPLSNWETSGDLPIGAPAQVKLGVWVAGTEMRFFLNDHYQFTVFDQIFRSGSVGYFASVRSEIGLNVSFSDLRVNAVSYVSPTPTVTPSNTPLPSRTPRVAP